MIHASEKSLSEFGDKVECAYKDAIEHAIVALREAMAEEDPAAIQAGIYTLQQASMKLGEAMYKEQAEAGSDEAANGVGETGETTSENDESVVDADFEEVKDDDQPAR